MGAVPEEPFTEESIIIHNQISVILLVALLASGPGILACSRVLLEAFLHIIQFPVPEPELLNTKIG